VSRGLNGPWEELSRREAIKKTCQALRDCNRSDRATYAHGVAAPTDVKEVAEELATSGLALKDRAARAAEECAVETSSRLREAMEQAGVPEETIEEQLRRQRADPTYVIPGFAMTASGAFAPIAQPGYPAVMQVIGPDGIPIPTHDPVPTPGQMPGIYSMYPHPAVDAAPMNMEAHLAARMAAGYVHPDDRAAMEAQQQEAEEHLRQQEEAAAGMNMKEEDAAAAAEEAAAAVANLDSAVAVHQSVEAQEAAEIAVAIAQDAADVYAAQTEEEAPVPPGMMGEEEAPVPPGMMGEEEAPVPPGMMGEEEAPVPPGMMGEEEAPVPPGMMGEEEMVVPGVGEEMMAAEEMEGEGVAMHDDYVKHEDDYVEHEGEVAFKTEEMDAEGEHYKHEEEDYKPEVQV